MAADDEQMCFGRYRLASLFVVTAVVASILSAIIAGTNSYEIYGAVESVCVQFWLWLFILSCIPFLFFRRLRRASCSVMIAGCLAFNIWQAPLAKRLRDLRTEVPHIIAYLEKYDWQKGKYPDDLSGYTFRDPTLKPYITYFPSHSRYSIVYHVFGYAGTGHWYDSWQGYYFEDD